MRCLLASWAEHAWICYKSWQSLACRQSLAFRSASLDGIPYHLESVCGRAHLRPGSQQAKLAWIGVLGGIELLLRHALFHSYFCQIVIRLTLPPEVDWDPLYCDRA